MEKKWWKEAVVYQIYPRSFRDSNGDGIGDLNGVTSKLDYLKDLGIDVIWLCPMFKSPNDDNGYDISDYEDIMEEFGTMEDFDLLLAGVHARGMKLILDLVVNHTSDEHPWFIESRSSKESEKRDWYIWQEKPNNWESIFSGSAWEYDEATGEHYMHLFSKKQPDLNWENRDVREAVYGLINRWLDKGIDGFRVDAISHIKKTPGFPDMPNPEGKDVVSCFPHMMNVEGIDRHLTELADRTFRNYDIMTVGEANGVRLEEAEKWVGEANGYFNMIFQFEHLGLWDKSASGGIDVHALKYTLSKWQNGLEGCGWNALFFENHDQARSVSTWGNDREYWEESAKSLAALYFFMKGTPYIYQGQEIGMTNVRFPSIEDYDDVGMKNFYRIETGKGRSHEEIMEIIYRRGRDNSRTPMQWNDGHQAGFTEGDSTWMGVNPNYKEINVQKQSGEKDSILSFYRSMIALRKQHPTLIYGRYDLAVAPHDEVYAYTRTDESGQYLILANLSSKRVPVYVDDHLRGVSAELLLANYSVVPNEKPENFDFRPYECRVYRLNR